MRPKSAKGQHREANTLEESNLAELGLALVKSNPVYQDLISLTDRQSGFQIDRSTRMASRLAR
jgi:hypothetical protein